MDKPWQRLFEKVIIMYFFLIKAKQIFKMVIALVFIRKTYWVFGKWISLEFCNVANFTPQASLPSIYLLLCFILRALITLDTEGVYISLFFKVSFSFTPSPVLYCLALPNIPTNLHALGFIFDLRGRRGLWLVGANSQSLSDLASFPILGKIP